MNRSLVTSLFLGALASGCVDGPGHSDTAGKSAGSGEIGTYATGFERLPPGSPYGPDAWAGDGFDVAWVQALEASATVDGEWAAAGSRSLKVRYPEGGVGPEHSGGQAKLMLPPRREYRAAYWLRFGEDFSWGGAQKGGKLPGLAGGDNCSGGMRCDGTNGFSARYMWRGEGEAVLYLYHMDKPHKWGEDFPLTLGDGSPVIFPPGEWVHLEQRLRVNSVRAGEAVPDGEVQVWYNGREVLHLTGLRLVANDQQVDNFYFSTFHGGNTAEWAPRVDSWIWYDELNIAPGEAP